MCHTNEEAAHLCEVSECIQYRSIAGAATQIAFKRNVNIKEMRYKIRYI